MKAIDLNFDPASSGAAHAHKSSGTTGTASDAPHD
jgi:hypothetical protein